MKRRQGVRLGRPRQLPRELVARIVAERAAGRTLQAIADDLDAEGVPTAQGGRWRPGTVAVILRYGVLDAQPSAPTATS